ncbi:MAG: response regulator [Pseudomonadota bacterium]|nr:response regulator [Pseudomonadota bacterium]
MSSVSSIDCYLVDDDEAFRVSLVALLTASGYPTTAFATTEEFLSALPSLDPGIVLLDLRMLGVNGLDMLEQQAAKLERFAVVMISGHGDIERAVRSIQAGAVEFIEKPFEPSQLLTMLEAVGERLAAKRTQLDQRHGAASRVALLSPRELEVLRMLLAGSPNKIVARTLDLSVRTVEMHRAHMLSKLSAKSTAEALHIAMLAEVAPW